MSQIEITDQNRPHCPLCGEAQRRMIFVGYYEDVHAWVCGCGNNVRPDGQVVGSFANKINGIKMFDAETSTSSRIEWREVSQ